MACQRQSRAGSSSAPFARVDGGTHESEMDLGEAQFFSYLIHRVLAPNTKFCGASGMDLFCWTPFGWWHDEVASIVIREALPMYVNVNFLMPVTLTS